MLGSLREQIRDSLLESARVQQLTSKTCSEDIFAAAEIIAESLRRGGKLLLCGNGGSAGDAQHLAAEFTGRAQPGRERPPLAALAITTDTSALTAMGNDYGFEQVFRRQVAAYGKPEDTLLSISTSGNSKNVVSAVCEAKTIGMRAIGLLGGNGGVLAGLVDLAIIVPSSVTSRIQESHLAIAHTICDIVEQMLFPDIAADPSRYASLERWQRAAAYAPQ